MRAWTPSNSTTWLRQGTRFPGPAGTFRTGDATNSVSAYRTQLGVGQVSIDRRAGSGRREGSGRLFTQPWVQWGAVAVFTVLGGLALWRAATTRRPVLVVGHVLHALTAAGMIAMAGPWWPVVSPAAQLTAFGLASAWFVALAVLRAGGLLTIGATGGHGVWHLVGHAVMMLAMVWMVVAMLPVAPSSSPTASVGAPVSGLHRHGVLPTSLVLPGIAATAALVAVAALVMVELTEHLRTVPGRRARLAGDLVPDIVMSLGMAGMCWTMLAA